MDRLNQIITRIQKQINANTETLLSDKVKQAQYLETERGKMGIDCEICNNEECLFYTDQNGYEFAKECSCMTLFKNKLRIKNSGLINLFTSYTFEKYLDNKTWQKSVKDKALSFLEDTFSWFYIGGSVGSGKSHICTAICGELIKTKKVYYMAWRDEVVTIKSVVNNDEEYSRITQKLKTIKILYIDDFFKGNVTQADINVAFEILNYRYINRLQTIISSERTIDSVLEIDEAIGSRIYQMCKGYEITLNGEKNIRMEDTK